jgi:hypothetical protein
VDIKAKAQVQYAPPFAQSEIPMAMKALAAGLAKEWWDELTQDVIM